MSIDGFTNVLVLAPHTDDGEFGCGGTMARLIENDVRVTYAAFSTAAKSVPDGFPKDVLKHEVRAATGVLGIPETDLKVYDFEVRTFPTVRQDILEEMIVLQQELDPDCVLLPALIDLHQDHKTIAEEGLRAFKRTTVMAYEIPWNNLNFEQQAYVQLEERHIQKKVDALGVLRQPGPPQLPERGLHPQRRVHPRRQHRLRRSPRCSRSTAGSSRAAHGRPGEAGADPGPRPNGGVPACTSCT